jgi:hypothetical protein
MRTLTEGTYLRWIDPEPDSKALGIVLSPVSEDLVYVLMADREGNTDIEVYVARPEATGRGASELVQESLEVVEDGDPDLMGLLRALAARFEAELGA